MTSKELYQNFQNETTRTIALEDAYNLMQPAIFSLIKTYYPYIFKSPYEEDIKQECYIAIHQALTTYNPDKEASFQTWASLYLKNTITEKSNQFLNSRSTYELKKYGRVEIISYEGVKGDKSNIKSDNYNVSSHQKSLFEILETKKKNEKIHEAINSLPEELKYIIIKLYGIDGKRNKRKQVAQDLGLSVDQVYLRKRKGLELLKDLLADLEEE